MTNHLFSFFSQYEHDNYKDLRRYILEMNKGLCKLFTESGMNGDEVYDTLNKKKEEIWRRMHSDPTPSGEDSKEDSEEDSEGSQEDSQDSEEDGEEDGEDSEDDEGSQDDEGSEDDEDDWDDEYDEYD